MAAAKKPLDYHTLLENSLYDISIISLVAIIWAIFILLYTSKRWKYMPHAQTLLLLISQGTACIGSILYHKLDFSVIWTQYIQFTLLLTGVYASRINSAIIALNLLLLARGKAKLVSKYQSLIRLFPQVMRFMVIVFIDIFSQHIICSNSFGKCHTTYLTSQGLL